MSPAVPDRNFPSGSGVVVVIDRNPDGKSTRKGTDAKGIWECCWGLGSA